VYVCVCARALMHVRIHAYPYKLLCAYFTVLPENFSLLSRLHSWVWVCYILLTCCTAWGSVSGRICCVCCAQLLFCLDCILFGFERDAWAPGLAWGMRRRTLPTAFVRPSRKTCINRQYIGRGKYTFWNPQACALYVSESWFNYVSFKSSWW
jgi:hypothetical protein